MIIYESIKRDFMEDVERGVLINKIYSNFQDKIGRTGKSEINLWQNSLRCMYMVMNDEEIPGDSGIAIEYKIPTSSKRIDFIIFGYKDEVPSAVVVELKQWSEVEKVDGKDGIVRTILSGGMRETPHPSYQVSSYISLIKDFNDAASDDQIGLYPCAFLHNRAKINNDYWIANIKASKESIDILGYAVAFLPELPDVEDMLMEKSKAGCRIRILLGKPESDAVNKRNIEEAKEGSISSRIEISIARLGNLIDNGAIEVKLHDTPLYCSIYRFDNRMLVTPHQYGVRGALAPPIELKRVEKGLFKSYLKHFDSIWDISDGISI